MTNNDHARKVTAMTNATPATRHPATEPGRLVRRYLDQATADKARTTYAVRLLEISRLVYATAFHATSIAVFVSRTPRRVHLRILQGTNGDFVNAATDSPAWLTQWNGSSGETWNDLRATIEDHLNAILATAPDPAQWWSRTRSNQLRAWGLNPRLVLWDVPLVTDLAIEAFNALDQTARRPAAPLDHIRAIVGNSLDKEQADYREQPEEDRAGHPYLSLLKVNNWLAQVDPHADEDDDSAPPIDADILERVLINNIGRHATETIFAELDQAQSRKPGTPNPELRGCMVDGYDDDDVNNTLGEILDDTGHTIVCLWEHMDTGQLGTSFGGHSNFYVDRDGQLYELGGDLWRWLNNDPSDPDTPAEPGHPNTWLGSAAGIATRDLATDNRHNYARHHNA